MSGSATSMLFAMLLISAFEACTEALSADISLAMTAKLSPSAERAASRRALSARVLLAMLISLMRTPISRMSRTSFSASTAWACRPPSRSPSTPDSSRMVAAWDDSARSMPLSLFTRSSWPRTSAS